MRIKRREATTLSSAAPRVLQRGPVHSLGEDKNKMVPKKQRATLRKKIHETHPGEEQEAGMTAFHTGNLQTECSHELGYFVF